MNQENKNQNLFKKIQIFMFKNYIQLIISLVILLIIFIGFQTYNYFKIQDIKNSSISFFDIIQDDQNDLSIENLIDDDNIFSILSKLKLIQQNNQNKNFSYSNELYKELLASSNLNDLYKTSIAANASYTMINASYEENTNKYLNDITIYINNISDEFDGYFSIKKDLKNLLIVTEIDLNKTQYDNNSIVLDKYTQNRILDKKLLIQSTHNLNKLFSNNSISLSLFRKIGMRIFNRSKFLKKQSMLFAMGLKDFKL